MSSFTPRAWKSQPASEAEHRTEAPVEPLHPNDLAESNNLPIASTDFIGRERDVADVKALLSQHRLVTLVGSGGVGKTRLALQVGTELIADYPDGVWFVDFAPISDPELVSSITAQALSISQQEGRRVDESIPFWLKRKKLLLIFDNCEHVIESVASLAAAILATAQDVRIVATSRQALGIGGEEPMRIPSLDVPRAVADLSAAKVMEFAAVALFVSRATTADRSFTLTDDTAPIVAGICRRLDGIPLAIELAAARVKVLSVPHLAERLNERFKILTGGSRDALPRQKTLSALLDWSYDLLSPQEQLLFERLGIFAGGFGLDAATKVCGGDGLDEIDILDLLASLTDKSLVAADTSSERERYRLLESTAAYALEKLGASGRRDEMARRHAEYFRDQALAASETFGTGSTFAWLAGAELELDNNRAALAWALTLGHDAVLGGAIAGALDELWRGSGLGVEGRYWIGLALERISEVQHPQIAARLWLSLAHLASGKRLRDAAERAMRLYKSMGDDRGVARAQSYLAYAHFQMGRLEEAHVVTEQALATARASGDSLTVGRSLNQLAFVMRFRGNVRAARELFGQALTAARSLGDELATATVLNNMAEDLFGEGHSEEALRAANEALEIQLHGKNTQNVGICHVNIAAYRIALGEPTEARNSARAGLRVAQQGRFEALIAVALQHLAALAALGGDARRGAQLLGYVDAQLTALGMLREHTEQQGYDKVMAALRETLSEDEIAQLSAEGAAWSEERAVEEALQL
ncbi:MAG TPA: tetratricopeptide repeat protein [Candidatus Eremiobacteraceae bacterium]|nr:tetratricopeptide repeat protein [Candidatus Eremiobacteraceae bacterium]